MITMNIIQFVINY